MVDFGFDTIKKQSNHLKVHNQIRTVSTGMVRSESQRSLADFRKLFQAAAHQPEWLLNQTPFE